MMKQAQFIPEEPQDNQKDHIGGIFQKIEQRSCPFVEVVLTSRATERAIAERGLPGLFFGSGSGPIWAVHETLRIREVVAREHTSQTITTTSFSLNSDRIDA